jgi:hypothetical protein
MRKIKTKILYKYKQLNKFSGLCPLISNSGTDAFYRGFDHDIIPS